MTVKELIEKLNDFHPDLEILTELGDQILEVKPHITTEDLPALILTTKKCNHDS